MGSRVNVCSVSVLDNPAKFTDPFKLEITFEVFEPLPDDLDWELVYVGAAESEKYDQVLDSVLVGPVVEGRHKFIFEADGPDPSKISKDDIVGVTVLLLKCSYREQLFIKVGWFVTVEYTDPEMKENPPITPILDKLQREVCEEDVLVTTFPIRWANASEEVLEGDAEANGSPVKESGDAPELLSRTNGINVEPTVSWEATANMQQGEPLVSIKGCQLVEECNRQHEVTSDSDFTKKLLEELSGIFGKQTTIPTSTLLPSDRINAADSSIVAKDQSSTKKSSIATWIELINAIGNMLRRSSDSSPPQSASHDVNPVNGVSNDGTTQKRLRPFKSSNSALQWFDDYVRNPMIGDSESQYTAATRQLDTGGTNFNRLILSEDESTGNPFFGKFIRKGFDWSDGNLRLVDMEGNKLLGSELTVHDRSVDIPLQPWLEAVDSFFRPYPQNEPFIVENVY